MPSCVESRFSPPNRARGKSRKKKWLLQSPIHDPPSAIFCSNPSVGIKLVVLDGLNGDGGGGAEDCFFVDGAGDLGGGARETEDELAVASCAGDMLQEFQGNVCGIEVGENQHIGTAAGFGSGDFDFRRGGIESDIGLELAFDVDFKKLAVGFGLGK